jgi:hypothetical protein
LIIWRQLSSAPPATAANIAKDHHHQQPCCGQTQDPLEGPFIKTGDQKSFEMPYPSAAIQTPFTATASPMPATGQADRIASTAFVTKTLLSSLIARGFSVAKAAGM